MLAILAQTAYPTETTVLSIFNNPMVVFFGAIALMAIVPTALHYWASVRAAESRANLVQDLASRGMTPAEIKEILAAAKLEKNVA